MLPMSPGQDHVKPTLAKQMRHLRLGLKHNDRVAWVQLCGLLCVVIICVALSASFLHLLGGVDFWYHMPGTMLYVSSTIVSRKSKLRTDLPSYIPLTNDPSWRKDIVRRAPDGSEAKAPPNANLTHDRVTDWTDKSVGSAQLSVMRTARADYWALEPAITVLVVIVRAEEHLGHFLKQLPRQTAFKDSEFLFLSLDEGSEPQENTRIGEEFCMGFVKKHANAAFVSFQTDPGLYGMWNFATKLLARGTAITNWNADDRKHSDSLRRHWAALERYPEVMAVASAIMTTYTPNLNWEDARKHKDTQIWWSDLNQGQPFLIQLQDLFNYNRFGGIQEPNNLMHNSPMWRKALHHQIGYMDESTYSSAADFAFWLTAARHLPGSLLFLPTPLELYYMSQKSYGREQEQKNPKGKQRVVADFQPFIRYKRLRVLVAHEKFPCNCNGGDIRILGLVKWLVLRGYDVTFVSRGDMWQVSEEVEGGRLNSWGVKYYHSDLSHMDLDILWSLGSFDVAFLNLWFWRCSFKAIPDLAMPILRQTSPGAKLAVLSDDVHWLRDKQISYCGKWEEIQRMETQVYILADLVLTITDKDRDAVRNLLRGSQQEKVAVFPFVHDELSWDLAKPPSIPPQVHPEEFGQRAGLVFVGSFHDGNRIGVAWFLQEVLPLIVEHMKQKQQQGDKRWTKELVTFSVVGDSQWVDWAQGDTRFPYSNNMVEFSQFLPRQPSVDEWMKKAAVFVAPSVVSGTGISTKNMMAISKGMALVTTPAGLDGFDSLASFEESFGHPVARTADEPAEFARHVIELLEDEQAWVKQMTAASRYAVQHLTWDVFDRCIPLMALLQSQARRTQSVGQTSRSAAGLPFLSRATPETVPEGALEELLDYGFLGSNEQDQFTFRSDGVFWEKNPEFPPELRDTSQDEDMAEDGQPHAGAGAGRNRDDDSAEQEQKAEIVTERPKQTQKRQQRRKSDERPNTRR
eukprot:gb/GEZN01001026.1/.p1 GENE.gb/GEZN01001026.1/~~gb/GEZN01001026.1/.p1  ORF type:complete len:968 (+),score=141.72 gb/GEZN01001026.1/:223-3126(+)